jgi:indole-3-glycerol phosphate synthase
MRSFTPMPDQPGRSILGNILWARRRTLEDTRFAVPLERVQKMAEARQERRDFVHALTGGGPGGLRVIAELKRASPSRGLLRQHYRRREIAQGYVAGGASALSVLTEEHYFLGSIRDLTEVRQAVEIPVLRKDFILENYQVYESVAAGADALLLIVAALPDSDLCALLDLCKQLRIAALVEVHNEEEVEQPGPENPGSEPWHLVPLAWKDAERMYRCQRKWHQNSRGSASNQGRGI